MSVNWNWSDKKGEVIWVKDDEPEKKFSWSIYQANCLCCMLKEYKDENGKDMYEFMTFYNDIHHLKKCLGLEKNWDGKYSNIFNIYSNFHVEKITLDINYPGWEQILKAFVKAGYKVECYQGETNHD